MQTPGKNVQWHTNRQSMDKPRPRPSYRQKLKRKDPRPRSGPSHELRDPVASNSAVSEERNHHGTLHNFPVRHQLSLQCANKVEGLFSTLSADEQPRQAFDGCLSLLFCRAMGSPRRVIHILDSEWWHGLSESLDQCVTL